MGSAGLQACPAGGRREQAGDHSGQITDAQSAARRVLAAYAEACVGMDGHTGPTRNRFCSVVEHRTARGGMETLMENEKPNPSAQTTDNPKGMDTDQDRPLEIAQRAYRRFEERGRHHGRDLEDWLEAERELEDGPAI
jgi:hypothetical protein